MIEFETSSILIGRTTYLYRSNQAIYQLIHFQDNTGKLTRSTKWSKWQIYVKGLGWNESFLGFDNERYQLTLEEASAIIMLDEV